MKKTLNIAHRGARSLAPENTIPALQKAWEIGADGIEIDVAVSRDEQLFLHHDSLLVRTTNVRECYPEKAGECYTSFTLAELKTLDAGAWFVREDPFGQIAAGNILPEDYRSFTGLSLPSLEEVLLFVMEKDWMVNIEIKKVPPPLEAFPVEQKLLGLLNELQIPQRQVILSSFVHEYLCSIQKKCPEIEVQALIGDVGEQELDWGRFRFATYNVNADLIDERQIATAQANNSRVNLFTVNDPEEMKRYIKAGVMGIITDFPQILGKLLQEG